MTKLDFANNYILKQGIQSINVFYSIENYNTCSNKTNCNGYNVPDGTS